MVGNDESLKTHKTVGKECAKNIFICVLLLFLPSEKGGGFIPLFYYKMSDLEIIKQIAEEEARLLDAFLVSISIVGEDTIEIQADTDPGIRLEEIIKLTRKINERLPEEIGERYSFEVSSPGVGKPLIVHRQYVKNVGRLAQFTLKDGTTLTGRILKVTENEVEIDEKQKSQKKGTKSKNAIVKTLPFSEISETKIKVEF